MGQFTVLVTDHDFDDLGIERDVLGDIATVRALSDVPGTPLDPNERLADADGVLNLRTTIGAQEFDRLDSCRIVARYGIGVDNVDLDAASDRGVRVTNVGDYCQEEVATHALSMALALLRHLKRYDSAVGEGAWSRSVAPPVRRFSTLTVGVVGFGGIGRAFGQRAADLGATVVASDPFLEAEDVADHEAELVEFDSLADQADLVSVHSPLTDGTRGLFDADVFERMKPTAYLVNVARGGIVVEDALLSALDAGELAGAGLDVFADEPPTDTNPLCDHEAVLTTPHVAWYSEEANRDRRRVAAENVRAALLGEQPRDLVTDG